MSATIIFLGPRCRLGSCTLEQKTPMKTTGSILQDSNMMTTGKLVLCIAKIEP